MSFQSRPAGGTARADPLPGRLLDDRYDIGERIAHGGMATVYRAVDTRLDRVVAVKVMHRHLADDGDFAGRFVREARAAARLNDPGVVAVFDQGEDDGSVYLVMELVPGRTLRDVVREETPLPPVRALALVARVAAALASAHAAGLMHRDVKPENVLLGVDGAVKVADFGLAGALDGGIGQSAATATGGLLIGTVSYLAPELVLGHRADARSDVYSCGIVAYELLTGSKPHTGETPIQIAYQHVHADVPPPSRVVGAGRVPDYLDALVARATARDRDLRPTDAGVLVRQVAMVRAALAQGSTADADLAGDLQPRSSSALTGPDGPPHPGHQSGAADLADLAELVDLVDGRADRSDRPDRVARPATRLFVDAEPTLVANGSSPATDNGPAQGRAVRVPALAGVGRRRRRGLLLLAVVLMLAVAAAAGGWLAGVEQLAETPRLVRMSERQAGAPVGSAVVVYLVWALPGCPHDFRRRGKVREQSVGDPSPRTTMGV